MKYINLDYIKFNKVCFIGSSYGVIWDAKYKDKPAIIKMITLTSGIHYNKDNDKYYDKDNNEIKYYNNVYNRKNIKPFIHYEFIKKRSIPLSDFEYELNQHKKLEEISLSPVIYDYGVSHTIDGFKYAFIVMEKWTTNVKDLLKLRKINSIEEEIIMNIINKLHQSGYVHGDMKPNNIGVMLNNKLEIEKCCFFDCYTIKKTNNLSEEEKLELINKDIFVYNHYKSKVVGTVHN
jgi:tRNA A-37 threonylcarbamoyl transferase component Bud32